LINQSILIENEFYLVGISDFLGRKHKLKPDFKKAFYGVDFKKPIIFLTHQPKGAKWSRKYKMDLVLSGHTHAGQIYPFGLIGSLRGRQKYYKGLYKNNDTTIYVHSGTGFSTFGFRLFAPSEIAEFIIN
jgi:predicted MPP superfamily phosphohydrolase